MAANPSAIDPRTTTESEFFTPDQWRVLHDEDRTALGSVSLLLMSIVAVGMIGMAIVVAIISLR